MTGAHQIEYEKMRHRVHRRKDTESQRHVGVREKTEKKLSTKVSQVPILSMKLHSEYSVGNILV